MSERKIRPGLSIDPELWNEFKSRYSNASQKVEELMHEALKPPKTNETTFSSEDISQFSFNDPGKWQLSYSSNTLNVTNSTSDNFTTSNSTDYRIIKIE